MSYEVMNDSLNQVVEGIKKTESFALDIGKGNLDSKYELLSQDDHLGEALLNMRESLIKNKEIEAQRKLEDRTP
jgi:nitrogen fixation/metabolism regulation signal transduction histidine kinase